MTPREGADVYYYKLNYKLPILDLEGYYVTKIFKLVAVVKDRFGRRPVPLEYSWPV